MVILKLPKNTSFLLCHFWQGEIASFTLLGIAVSAKHIPATIATYLLNIGHDSCPVSNLAATLIQSHCHLWGCFPSDDVTS